MVQKIREETGLRIPEPGNAYREMLRLRHFEEKAYSLFLNNHIHGTMHLGVGQEAVATGVAAVLKAGDSSLSTYRGHNHVIARGAALDASFGELFGREIGLCKGKGGSMHLTSVEHGHYGSYAIVGAHLPIACGIAWSQKLRGTDNVTVCFFGDGTTNIGAFHEALNLAAVWKLPVIFMCENNLYMEFTPIAEVTAVPRPAADRASAYGLEPIMVDGNDIEAVYDTTHAAVERARAGGGPALIEALTYRHKGHSRTDPARYRPTGELEDWLQRDPLVRFAQRLRENGWAQEELERMNDEVVNEVDEAAERALASPEPGESELFTDVYCGSETTWRN
jgi:acetoin:2,6-dichlorophenolindophenol oxidoreductase subunit alpha